MGKVAIVQGFQFETRYLWVAEDVKNSKVYPGQRIAVRVVRGLLHISKLAQHRTHVKRGVFLDKSPRRENSGFRYPFGTELCWNNLHVWVGVWERTPWIEEEDQLDSRLNEFFELGKIRFNPRSDRMERSYVCNSHLER